MFKITTYDKKTESIVNLKKLASKGYQKNRLFFGEDINPFEVKFFYARKDFNKYINRYSTPDWMVGIVKNRQVIIFSPSVFGVVSSHKKSDFEGVLSHEIAHVFKDDIFNFRHPVWLSEGLSGYISGQYKKTRHYKFTDFKLLHTREDWSKNSNYPQAYLFTAYLIKKFKKEKMINFFKYLGKEDSYNTFQEKFTHTFKTSFGNIVRDWSLSIRVKK